MPLALIRHPPVAIAPGVCYGRSDVPLRAGTCFAALRAALAGFCPGPIWTSPARRCRLTAEALADGRDIRADARLLELDFGDWEGQRWDDIPRALLDGWAADPWHFAAPRGESAAAMARRVDAFLATVQEDGIIISHGGPLKILAARLAGEEPDLLAPAQALGTARLTGFATAAPESCSAASHAQPSPAQR